MHSDERHKFRETEYSSHGYLYSSETLIAKKSNHCTAPHSYTAQEQPHLSLLVQSLSPKCAKTAPTRFKSGWCLSLTVTSQGVHLQMPLRARNALKPPLLWMRQLQARQDLLLAPGLLELLLGSELGNDPRSS